MSRTISYNQLKKAGACIGQREMFETLFGKTRKVPATAYLCSALAVLFNFEWASNSTLLTALQRKVYDRELATQLAAKNITTDEEDAVSALKPIRLDLYARPKPFDNREAEAIRHATRMSLRKDRRAQIKGCMALAFAVAYDSPKRG